MLVCREKTMDDENKLALIIDVKNALKRNHVIIKPCCYNIPIGENGFIVSAYTYAHGGNK